MLIVSPLMLVNKDHYYMACWSLRSLITFRKCGLIVSNIPLSLRTISSASFNNLHTQGRYVMLFRLMLGFLSRISMRQHTHRYIVYHFCQSVRPTRCGIVFK